MRKILTFILFLSFLSVACSDAGRCRDILDRADAVMESNPDSALGMLTEIEDTFVLSSDNDKARYFLLLTQAQFKCYKPTPLSDRLDFSILHFEASDEKEYLSRALYYRGMTQYEAHEYDAAINNLKRGETIAETLGNDELLSKYYESLYGVNYNAGYNDMSLKYARLFLDIAEKMKNYDYIARANIDIGTYYNNKKDKIDSAFHYFYHCLSFVDSLTDDGKALVFANLGICYDNCGDKDNAKEYLAKSLKIKRRDHALSALADIYYDEGDEKVALELWNEALKTEDLSTKITTLKYLQNYHVKHRDYRKALVVAHKVFRLTDSLAAVSARNNIVELQLKYDNQVVEREYYQHLTFIFGLIIFLLCMIVVLIYVFRIKLRRYYDIIILKETQIDEFSSQITDLKKNSELSEKEIAKLRNHVKQTRDKYIDRQSKGKIIYDTVISKSRFRYDIKNAETCFIAYYAVNNAHKFQQWEREYRNLTAGLWVYLILQDMGYSDKDIANILSVSNVAIRTKKSRLKLLIRVE